MDFFNNFVIPSGANHIALHKYILTIALLLLVPYLCMLMGAMTLSMLYNKMGRKYNNHMWLKFSRDVIDKLGIGNAQIALGIIPALSVLLSYIQLMAGAKTIVLGMLTLAVMLLIIAFILIYKYRSSLRLTSIIGKIKKGTDESKIEDRHDVETYEHNLSLTKSTSGKAGWSFLIAGVYMFAASLALANSPDIWASTVNILHLIFSLPAFFNFLFFVFASGLITGAGILFYFFVWEGGVKDRSPEYDAFVKNIASLLAIISGIMLPVAILLNMTYIPKWAFTQNVYVWALLSLVTALIVTMMLYYAIKNSETKFAAAIFALSVLIFLFNIIKDQGVFAHATREQEQLILQKGDEYEKEKRSKVVSTSSINGEEVYTQKCASCHKFDAKIVGPAYKDVVPKYNGDVKKLQAYIMNPTKVDPAFPPMPNPGLKPKEAQAVSEYLIKNLGK